MSRWNLGWLLGITGVILLGYTVTSNAPSREKDRDYQLARLIVDVLKQDKRVHPGRVIIDHVEEHTMKLVLDSGMWAGMTLYPESKCSPPRAVDMVEVYGNERVWMNCACDWGVSDPLAVPKTALEMKKRGHRVAAIENVVFQNPKKFLSQSRNFKV